MNNSISLPGRRYAGLLIATVLWSASTNTNAALLSAASGVGTLTISFDREPFALMLGGSLAAAGIFHSHFYDAAASNYLTQSGGALLAAGGNQEQSALSLRHDVTPAGTDPLGQAVNRHVQATSADFSLDSETLAGTGKLGLTGVQKISVGTGIWAGSSLVYGDYALRYDPSGRQAAWDANSVAGLANGWFLENHIYNIVIAVYEFANLSLTASDTDNWQLRGDLLISPENAHMLTGIANVQNVGDFCLGFGSYAGCTAAPVPLPAAFWLFAAGLAGLPARKPANSPEINSAQITTEMPFGLSFSKPKVARPSTNSAPSRA